MLKFLIINGPNINMLGLREPDIYGTENYRSLQQFIYHCCVQEDIEPVLYQSNHEGAIVDRIQAAYGDADGIVINPAAYTHTSVAILDALRRSAFRRSKCTCRISRRERASAGFRIRAWPA
jgi:3-dehydroquinate dehydratase-2